ncbi:E3 ubiquitin-protein ligase MPSR1-like [Malania oleifera]|uniref:E3 ubiquitin-protein ligase MPSR1-like n=1 Tax=Malania oleifera TaxID=397392 RepID=UPI0025ADDEA9|nr:E3 ubiquitin-protein ligase MPSR1-like [Malania oleifera]
MASESETQSSVTSSPTIHELMNGDRPLPFLVGVATTSPPEGEPGTELSNQTQTPDRVFIYNPFMRSVAVFDAPESEELDELMRELERRGAPGPASEVSINAMPSVKVAEDGLCPICLGAWKSGDEARETPCKHEFHGECIEKWLGIRGSCPVCRFEMPVDQEQHKRIFTVGAEGRRVREIWVRWVFHDDQMDLDSDLDSLIEALESGPEQDDAAAVEELSTPEDMECSAE